MNGLMKDAGSFAARKGRGAAGALLAFAVLAMAGYADDSDNLVPPDEHGVPVVYGIRGGSELIRFLPEDPATVARIGAISGLGAGETVLGIDFRPSDRHSTPSSAAARC